MRFAIPIFSFTVFFIAVVTYYVHNAIQTLQQDYSELKQDYSELKQDYSELKQDHTELKQDYTELKQVYTKNDNELQSLKEVDAKLKKEVYNYYCTSETILLVNC